VLSVLKSTVDRGIRVNVLTTNCLQSDSGEFVHDVCEQNQIPCKVIKPEAVGLCMASVDCVFVSAEAVLENGGIVNNLGTFTIAMCAKNYNKPFYVFAESLKFLKSFPLQQSDIFALLDEHLDSSAEKTDVTNIQVDYTPPEYISNLFTEIGIFTPAAVSDEIIQYF